jgi:hypothetical protein
MSIELNLPTLMAVAGIGLMLVALLGDALERATILNIEFAALGRLERILIGVFGIALLAGGVYWAAAGNQNLAPAAGGPVEQSALAGQQPGSSSVAATARPAPTGESAQEVQEAGADCFTQFFEGIPADRVITLESGIQDVDLVGQLESKDVPIGLRFTENRQPVGALTFDFFSDGDIFKISDVIDGSCQPVDGLAVEGRPGETNVLQNWDTLEMQLGETTYAVRLGYDAGVISALYFSRIVP